MPFFLHHQHQASECDASGEALGLLPEFVAERTNAIRVREVQIP